MAPNREPFFFVSFLILLHALFQCVAQLIGAGGRSGAALDAAYTSYDVARLLSFDQSADALGVAMTTAHELNFLDDVIVIHFDMYHFRTCTLCDVIN